MNAVIQYNDNRFLANGQWAGHNNHCAYAIIHIMYSQSKSQKFPLIQSAVGESSCSVEEYVAGEDALPVCADFDCEDWDENWLNSLNDNPNSDTGDNPDSDTEEVDYDLLPPPPKLTCFKQAIEFLEDVQVFLEHRGYVEQATSVGKVMINLTGISFANYTQTRIDEYFS